MHVLLFNLKIYNDLGTLSFAQDESGAWGYKVGGADTVTPFKTGEYGSEYLRYNEETGYIQGLNDIGEWVDLYYSTKLPIESTHYLFKDCEFRNELTSYKSVATQGPKNVAYDGGLGYPTVTMNENGLYMTISGGNWRNGSVAFSPLLSANLLSKYSSLKIKISGNYNAYALKEEIFFCFTQTDPSSSNWSNISGCMTRLINVGSDLIITVPTPKVNAYFAIFMYQSVDVSPSQPWCTIEEMWLE